MAAFTDIQRARLARHGVTEAEALRQLALMSAPPVHADLVRTCTSGDGIDVIPDAERAELVLLHEQAAAQGRFTKFVPASGAATRMFQELLGGSGVPEFLAAFPRFAFVDDLRARLALRGIDLDALRKSGDDARLVETLLGRDGLAYASTPKGLIPFHRAREGPRTPFEEHLAEAAPTVADASGLARVHFTVSPEHLPAFRSHAERVVAAHERRLGTRFAITFSVQEPATDTIAGAPSGGPFTTEDGDIVLRPAGHGALLGNLEALGADLVLVKNIDNVQTDARRADTILWKKILGGALVKLLRETHLRVARLRGADVPASLVEEAAEFARARFGFDAARADRSLDERRRALLDALDRPLRVCGVVRNTGEPGGGPFWVRRGAGEVTRQIIEPAQVDPLSYEQAAIFRGATHFNPVDLACALRDAAGRPFDLTRFVDPTTSIVTRKWLGRHELVALERPGLWNGAMAGWLTVFVEVPISTFTPVKTVNDLLRPEHALPPKRPE